MIQFTIQKAIVKCQSTRIKTQTWINPGWLMQRHLTVQPWDSSSWFYIHQQPPILFETICLVCRQKERSKCKPLCLIKCRPCGRIIIQSLSFPPSFLQKKTRGERVRAASQIKRCTNDNLQGHCDQYTFKPQQFIFVLRGTESDMDSNHHYYEHSYKIVILFSDSPYQPGKYFYQIDHIWMISIYLEVAYSSFANKSSVEL